MSPDKPARRWAHLPHEDRPRGDASPRTLSQAPVSTGTRSPSRRPAPLRSSWDARPGEASPTSPKRLLHSRRFGEAPRFLAFFLPHLAFLAALFLPTADLEQRAAYAAGALILTAALTRLLVTRLSAPSPLLRLLSYGATNAASLPFALLFATLVWPSSVFWRAFGLWTLLGVVLLLACLWDFAVSLRDAAGCLRGRPHRFSATASWGLTLIAFRIVSVVILAFFAGLALFGIGAGTAMGLGDAADGRRDYDAGYEDGRAAGWPSERL